MPNFNSKNCCDDNGGYNENKPTSEVLSCSPFCTRPWKYRETSLDFVNNVLNNGTRDYNRQLTEILCGDPYSTSVAWYDYSDGGADNYFVFHFADGAGIQPDYFGDIKYVEQFGDLIWSPEQGGDTTWPAYHDFCGRNHSRYRRGCNGRIYKWHWSGWWTSGKDDDCDNPAPNGITEMMIKSQANGAWGAGIGDKIRNLDNPYIWEHDPNNTKGGGSKWAIQFTSFAWVYYKDDSETGAFEQAGIPGYKQYADNEPMTDGKGGRGWPPLINVYFMLLEPDPEHQGGYHLNADWYQLWCSSEFTHQAPFTLQAMSPNAKQPW